MCFLYAKLGKFVQCTLMGILNAGLFTLVLSVEIKLSVAITVLVSVRVLTREDPGNTENYETL